MCSLATPPAGWVANLVARRLEELGVRPLALVLLDTYRMTHPYVDRIRESTLKRMFEDGTFPLITGAQLTAQGGYLRVFERWEPQEVAAATLFVHAASAAGPAGATARPYGADDWRASWDFPHTSVEVLGDHFTIVDEYAESTAEAIHKWLLASH